MEYKYVVTGTEYGSDVRQIIYEGFNLEDACIALLNEDYEERRLYKSV